MFLLAYSCCGLRAGAYSARVIVADVGPDSIRPSLVQMAPMASQSVVSGRVTVTGLLSVGFTVMVHPMLLPWVTRWTCSMVDPGAHAEGVVSDTLVAGVHILAEGKGEGELGGSVVASWYVAEAGSERVR